MLLVGRGRATRLLAGTTSLFWLLTVVFSNAAAATLNRIDLERSLERETIAEKSQVITEQLRSASPDWRLVIAALEDNRVDAATQEYLLGRFLIQIRSHAPDRHTRSFVSELATFESQTFVWHEEGPLPVAAYPIAQLALGTLQVWDTVDAKRRAIQDFERGIYAALNHLRLVGTVSYAGTLQALQSADPLQISAAKNWLLEYSNTTEAFEAFALVALRTSDVSLTRSLLRIDNGAASLRLLRGIRDHFPNKQSFELLRGAMANPMLASAVVAEIDKLRTTSATRLIDDFLLQLLADPLAGSSAALALARQHDKHVMGSVAAVLDNRMSTPDHQSRAVLFLTLVDSDSSRSVLQRVSAPESTLHKPLKQEVLKWLAQ